MWRKRCVVTGLAVLALLVGGCSGGGSNQVKWVRGRVLLDGQPLGGATVQFRPQKEGDLQLSPFSAKTDPDGTFEIKPGPRLKSVPGRYAVFIF
jgi:hypothetical protein